MQAYSIHMKRKHPKPPLTAKALLKKGVPAVLIPGLLLAMVLGWNPGRLQDVSDYHDMKLIFPYEGKVANVEDGDTFSLTSGVRVRMLGINAPDRGDTDYAPATEKLRQLIGDKHVFLEYDRYNDDKYGRVLAWVWVGCEGPPTFLPEGYMHKTYNTSNPGLTENPKRCKAGSLANEEMVRSGFAAFVKYKERGELKYEQRIRILSEHK
jgi:endonuclease YncB( thermonuclease family)